MNLPLGGNMWEYFKCSLYVVYIILQIKTKWLPFGLFGEIPAIMNQLPGTGPFSSNNPRLPILREKPNIDIDSILFMLLSFI